jgi:hypothetical protein
MQSCQSRGYGQIMVGGRMHLTHRVAYELANGAIPAEFFVCHICDVRRCCNPAHLFLGTPEENTRDMVRKGRASRPKLSDSKVAAIKEALACGRRQGEIALEYGVHPTLISLIHRGRIWRQVA